ncbi:MAG: hypothetical protein HY700_10855 [Gemmatimonadetes bacterium]|nr:hypothetical protein [Gemmatimonadota bacterium]
MDGSARTARRAVPIALGGIVMLFLALAIPAPAPSVAPAPPGGRAFAWDQDSVWDALEGAFVRARRAACADSAHQVAGFNALAGTLDRVRRASLPPTAPVLDSLESRFFAMAPLVAACPVAFDQYVNLYARMREAIKGQSRHWDVNAPSGRDRLYRSLYGGRAAVEEVMLQHPERIVALLPGAEEPSAAPAAVAHGVELHSGDILVSRGGYPTSALIARGNDYPGNFSHVGLVHVDERAHEISVIEAHIERGVAISSFEQYLADKKLRLMLLRLRADLPALQADPLLPHRAAEGALTRARAGHIPYDFTMDYSDPSRLFCSEVASSAYHELGVDLWMGISTISAAGLRRWLASFGVEHFETQEPSDLEYDPQLVVVAEWRDAESLFQDHVDNAVTDVMLEGAERGDDLRFPWYTLPPARLARAYSWGLERMGRTGPLPEGMAAAAALRNRVYSARHRAWSARVGAEARAWAAANAYRTPYWTLIELARAVGEKDRGE